MWSQKVPWINEEADDGADEEAGADGDVFWEECCKIIASWQGIFEDGGEYSTIDEHGCDEEAACAVGGGVAFVSEFDRASRPGSYTELARSRR